MSNSQEKIEQKKEPFLSICITSYNRVNELIRCLSSVDGDENEIEIVVSEDKSPKREQIREALLQFKLSSKYPISANFNEENLGYDRNLAKLISLATGKYILFCSDDDAFNEGMLQHAMQSLKKNDPTYMYTAFTSSDVKSMNRKYNESFVISGGKEPLEKYLYDGILFSGLIFKREAVNGLISDMDRFINTNYFQIYLLAKMLYHYDGYYENFELINCINDGENAYGTTELSNKDPLLADRSNVFSDIRFNIGLIKVIRIFDDEENTRLIERFQKEYSLRSYRGLSKARAVSRKCLKKYWKTLKELDIKLCFPAGTYYRVLWLFGTKISDAIFGLPRKLLYFRRRRNK